MHMLACVAAQPVPETRLHREEAGLAWRAVATMLAAEQACCLSVGASLHTVHFAMSGLSPSLPFPLLSPLPSSPLPPAAYFTVKEQVQHLWPFNRLLDPWPMGDSFFWETKRGVLSYVIARPLMTAVSVLTNIAGEHGTECGCQGGDCSIGVQPAVLSDGWQEAGAAGGACAVLELNQRVACRFPAGHLKSSQGVCSCHACASPAAAVVCRRVWRG